MEYKFTALDDVEVSANERTVKGYASVFGGVDDYRDTIVKGAYAATIKAHPRGLTMLDQHKGVRVGRWTLLKEDGKGLWVEGELTPDHTVANDLYASLKAGHVEGLSIGYGIPPGGSSERSDGVRILKRIDLFEISVVDNPADRAALVESVKAVDLQPREFRDLLKSAMRAAGCDLSRKEVEAFMAGGYRSLIATRDAGGQHEPEGLKSALLDAIRTARG